MSDWAFLNKYRVRHVPGFGSTDSDGFLGLFIFPMPGEARRIKVISSAVMGWQHVSVSYFNDVRKPPTWAVMCYVRDLFFDDDHWVMQLHPPKSDNINNHPGCLHLWRPINGERIPIPPSILVGIKELGEVVKCS